MTPTLRIMSTQHTGDGPPGDDDYYDPVEEENNRPSGSGTNINAAAWDPEKMELHRGSVFFYKFVFYTFFFYTFVFYNSKFISSLFIRFTFYTFVFYMVRFLYGSLFIIPNF